ncbi:MAG: hypothetical protein AAF467_04410 [Actinomycetota bacterium]
MTDGSDPVLVRRAKIAGWVSLGLRLGYGLFALAVVVFFAGIVFGFVGPLTAVITFCLIVGSFVLAPAIVFQYAVKAADRADREGSW